jgi:transposase-like protein
MTDLYKLYIPKGEEYIKVLREIRWSSGCTCPYCGSKYVILKDRESYNRLLQRYKCNSCNTHFNDLTKTVFTKRRLSLGEMFYI